MLAAAVNLAGAALSATLPRRGAGPSEDATS
jgi:hypothetical protein